MVEFDSPWKEAIDVFFKDFLKLFFTKVHQLIDWSRPPVGMDTELSKLDPDSAVGKRLAVLADDDPRWRPSSFEVKLAGSKIRLEFATVKLLDYAEKEPRRWQSKKEKRGYFCTP